MSVRISAVLAVLAAALTLGGGAGAGTASQPPKIDLSSPAAIDAYLRSVGVDPATVVKQIGLKNYAGPNCPGLGWNCTTAARVVQVSTENAGQQGQGDNEFECKGETPANPLTDRDTNTCFIVQEGPKNHAKCNEADSTEPVSTETCDVTQTGARNSADVDQEITQTVGLTTQTGNQIARVKQFEGETNESQIHQKIKQRDATGASQAQDGFQRADVEQYSSGSENFSHVHQTQDQNESGSAAMQSQNTGPNTLGDCADDKVPNPNQCVNVFQDATPNGGKNLSHLHQAIGERQSTTSAGNQTQGTSDGGQEGDVHQQNPFSSGQNLDFPHQDLRQWQSSSTGIHPIQRQATDPGCCGVGTQIGGVKNIEAIHQATTQSASEDDAIQSSTIFGQIHQLNDPANSCRIDQLGRNNADALHNSAESTDPLICADLELATVCTSGEGGSCQDVNPCDVFCGEIESVLATPTFGREIAMPDYDVEPSDYFGP
jgi:hypothetical protein